MCRCSIKLHETKIFHSTDACRVVVDGYLKMLFALNEHVNDMEEQQDAMDDFDFVESLKDSFVHPMPSYVKAGTFEWIAEGSRFCRPAQTRRCCHRHVYVSCISQTSRPHLS